MISVDKTQIVEQLAGNAENDPVEDVQKRCLSVLASQYQQHDKFVETARRLAHSSSPSIQLHARILAFQAEHDKSEAYLVEFANNHELDVHLRAEAWRTLGTKYQSDRTSFITEVLEPDILRRLTSRTASISETDLNALRDHGSPQTLQPLQAYLQRPAPEDLRPAARNAIKAIQSRTDKSLLGAVMIPNATGGGEVDIASSEAG